MHQNENTFSRPLPYSIERKTQSGFTLTEIAIVLVIGGLLLTAILGVVSAQRTNLGISVTKTKGEAIITALTSFVSRNHRLPCPAVANLVPTNPGYGVEAPNPGVCTGTINIGGGANIIMRGIVPWVSLGLSDVQGLDGYDRRFTYFVRGQETSRTADTLSAMRGNMTIHSGAPIALGLAGNQINSCSSTAGDNSCNLDAVAVIISHGDNGSGAFLASGTQMAAPPGVLEQENTDNDGNFINTGYSSNETNPFDDILITLDPDDLLRPLAENDSIPSARGTTMDRINLIREVLIAQIVNSNGAVPPALPPIPPLPNPPQDGWGMDFVYNQVLADACQPAPVPPGQTTFTLTSLGVDQTPGVNPNTGQNDDIVVVQNNDQVKLIIQKQGTTLCP